MQNEKKGERDNVERKKGKGTMWIEKKEEEINENKLQNQTKKKEKKKLVTKENKLKKSQNVPKCLTLPRPNAEV